MPTTSITLYLNNEDMAVYTANREMLNANARTLVKEQLKQIKDETN